MLQEAIDRNPHHFLAQGTLVLSYVLQWLSQQSPAAQTLEPAVAAVVLMKSRRDIGADVTGDAP